MKIWLGLFLLTPLGCGDFNGSSSLQSDIEALGATISPTGSSLSDEEVSVALRICYAYRSKGTRFRTDRLNKLFRFEMEKTDCDQSKKIESFNSTLKLDSNDVMYFDAPSFMGPYNRVVQTHDNGHLGSICRQLFAGTTPRNTSVEGDRLLEFSFLKRFQDGYLVRYGKRKDPTDSSEYEVERIERFYVQTNSQATGVPYGLVSQWEWRKMCSDGTSRLRAYDSKYQQE